MHQKKFTTYPLFNTAGYCSHAISKNFKEGHGASRIVQMDEEDCLLTWESQWQGSDPKKTHIFVVGEAPFIEEIAKERIQKYKIPLFQRFCLTKRGTELFPGFRLAKTDALMGIGPEHRLEIVGHLIQEKLLFLFQQAGKWDYKFFSPSTIARHLKHAGLSQVGTLYFIASQWKGNFLPSFAHELTGQGIQYGLLCSSQGGIYPQRSSLRPPERKKMRVICEKKNFSIPILQQHVVSHSVPMLREGGPDFDYEVIVQVGEDPAVEEAAEILVASAPFRTCRVQWFPSQGEWQLLSGEPRFLRLRTRWVVVAQSNIDPQRRPTALLGGLEIRPFALGFLRLLHSFETWQEVHGKWSHLLLIGPNLFYPAENSGFAFHLVQEFAALGCYIPIRVRGFVHRKDITGCLHAGWLTSASSLNWDSDAPRWERDLHWNRGQISAIDALALQAEVPLRKSFPSLFMDWQSSVGSDWKWMCESVVAMRWREHIRGILAEILQSNGPPPCHTWIPVFEAAGLNNESNLLWMDETHGGVVPLGACLRCLQDFEIYFQNLSKDLFEAFFVDGDFYLQKRIGVSTHLQETALRAGLALSLLVRSEKWDYFEKGIAVRLCSEFLKNGGEKNSAQATIFTRAWQGISRNFQQSWLAVKRQESAFLGALTPTDYLDEYETARAYQFSAHCIRHFPPHLSWRNFLDPSLPTQKLLESASEKGACTGAGITDGLFHLRYGKGNIYRLLSIGAWKLIQMECSGKSEGEIFCAIAHAVTKKELSHSILPLAFTDTDRSQRVGWFLDSTSQMIKAPPEAGVHPVLLGSSGDRERHYVFGENRIFQSTGFTWVPQGKALFALRRNGILILLVDYIADPPILDAPKIMLVGRSQCTRWKLGAALCSYQVIVLESCSGKVISGIIDLRPFSFHDCGWGIQGEDIVITELATGHLIVLRNGTFLLSQNHFYRGIQLRFAENCLSLQDLLDLPGNKTEGHPAQ